MFDEFPLAANVAAFLAAALVVWLAGTRLARYADGIAEITGIGRELLGLLLLGGITSLPEIAIAITSSLQGTPALSVHDVLGSAALNLVILALADMLIGRGALTSIQASPVLILQGVLGMLLMAIVTGAFVAGDVLFLGMGVWSWLMVLAYLGALRVLATSNAGDAWTAADADRVVAEKAPGDQPPLSSLVVRTAAAGAAILVAGFVLTTSGDALARQTGLGASFFAAIFLAGATSLPEVSTVIGAVRLRRYEMAMSDVLGTNLFNVTIVAVVDALHPGGPVLLETGRSAGVGALLALVLTALFLVGMIERRDRTVLRMGVDSLAALAAYAAGVVLLYRLR